MSEHPILTAAGVVAVAVGLAIVFRPGLAAAVSATHATVTVVGLIAVVLGLSAVQRRRHGEIEGADTGEPETAGTVPTPGETFDEALATLYSGSRQSTFRAKNDVRERLEAAAVAVVAQRDGCSPEDASDMVEAGTWTDDPYAAAFLGEAELPRRNRLGLLVRPGSSYLRQARRTADEIARNAGIVEGDER